jgi:hypothetical protein
MPLFRPPDTEIEQLVANRPGHSKQGIAAASQPTLDAKEGPCHGPLEVTLQHVAMKRVHDERNIGLGSCQAPQEPRLRHMGVHRMGLKGTDPLLDAAESTHVSRGVKRASQ